MDYYGLLFLYYLKGLSGKSVLRLFFNIEAGGTEQLLPENTSTPTTTPILADIQYPDGLRTDQYFTYRETPTTVSNKARIKTIKGNTLVWNQLASIVGEQTATNGLFNENTYIYENNKYLMLVDANVEAGRTVYLSIYYNNGTNTNYQVTGTASGNYHRFFTSGYTAHGGAPNVRGHFWFYAYNATSWKNLMLIDLTKMFGAGNEPATIEEFTSLFPLPYYAYNAGTLLSFNGNGIKTVGANQWHNPITGQTINDEGEVRTSANTDWMADKILIGADKKLYLYLEDVGGYTRGSVNIAMYGTNGYLGKINALQSNPQVPQKKVITLNQNTTYVIPYGYMSGGATSITDVEMTLANIDINEYVPYTSSTLSLPISTYFPTGMKSAGDVYDELTPIKAITRIGAVDLGTITYTYDGECFIGQIPRDAKVLSANTETLNSVSDRYLINNWSSVKYLKSNMTLGTGVSRYICIFNNSYTDATAFKEAMTGVYLYYELATPVELPTMSFE